MSLKYRQLKKFIINQSYKDNINYSLNSITSDELLTTSPPFEQYSEVSQELEQIKKLTKKLDDTI